MHGTIEIDEKEFVITANNDIVTLTDTPQIKSVKYNEDDNYYL